MYALCRCLQFVQCLEFNLNFWHWLTGAKIKSISEFKGWLFCNVFFVILMVAASWLPACEMWVWSGLGRALKKVISKCGQQRREVRCHGKYDYSITGPCYPHCVQHGRFCSPPELVAWCPLKIMKKISFLKSSPLAKTSHHCTGCCTPLARIWRRRFQCCSYQPDSEQIAEAVTFWVASSSNMHFGPCYSVGI